MDFKCVSREEAYGFVRRILVRFDYAHLGKCDKGLVKRLLAETTGLSRAQLTRLVGQFRATSEVVDRSGGPPRRPFERHYMGADIRLLADVDTTLGQIGGPATREVMRREYAVFGDERFAGLAHLSIAHLHNLRKRTTLTETRPTRVAIGERRRPRPEGRPDFARVDTVHQGDFDARKGIYLINAVDEVTQFEFISAVEAISERFLIPVLEGVLDLFPIDILGFHADNRSEYINHRGAELLKDLRAEFTKSRPRQSNENALAEGKNANVVRRWLGHAHIPRRFAPLVARFTLSPDLNFHRPCMFADQSQRTRAHALPPRPRDHPRRARQGAPPRRALPQARHHLRATRAHRPRRQ